MTSPARSPRQRLVGPHEIERHVADMTVTVSADVELAALQASLAEVGQWAAIDGPAAMPIGRLIEIDSTGPLRLGYGAWRDLLLGVQFTNGAGELITAGGRTVKNVAGYDLTKFMIGQCRVFGEIVTATMRTYRKPAGAVVARFAPDPAIVARLLTTPMRPQWAVLRRDRLLLGYLGDEPTLQFIERELPALEPTEKTRLEDDSPGRAVAWPIPESGVLMRVALPPAKIAGWTATLGERDWSAEPVFGIVLIADVEEKDVEALAASADAADGAARAFADLETAPRLTRISTNPGERQIIEKLKHAFDPDHRLQPLDF